MNRTELVAALLQVFQDMSTETILLHTRIAEILGLNITDHKCLGILYRHGPMPAGQLSKFTGLTTGAITGVIDRLEKAGYVRRRVDERDRRGRIIEPTNLKRSQKRLGSIFGPLATKTNEVMDQYRAEDLELILEFSRRLIAISRGEVQRLRKRRTYA